jgi:hypothetical protein
LSMDFFVMDNVVLRFCVGLAMSTFATRRWQ